MALYKMILIWLTLVACTSAATTYFVYQGQYPIAVFADFKYVPTDNGYVFWYRTANGATYQEVGIVPNVQFKQSDSGPDTLGSSKKSRLKTRMMLKNRKVSPKLLANLAG